MPDPTTLAEGIVRLHQQAAGVLRLAILDPQEVARLHATAKAGNADASEMMRAIGSTIGNLVVTVADRRIFPCFTCKSSMLTYVGASFCMIMPCVPGEVHTLTGVVCPACAQQPDVQGRAIDALKVIWPRARRIEISDTVGHA